MLHAQSKPFFSTLLSPMLATIKGRSGDVWASFRLLPRWVWVWLLILSLANTSALVLFVLILAIDGDVEPAFAAGAACGLAIAVTNGPVLLVQRGFTRLLSVFQLVAMLPAFVVEVVFLAIGSFAVDRWGGASLAFLIFVLVVNGVALFFDAADTFRYFVRKDHGIIGRDESVSDRWGDGSVAPTEEMSAGSRASSSSGS
jgi:hypothetical protein